MRAAVAILLVATTRAVANDAVPGLGDDDHATRSPGFVNMARYDGNSRVGVDVMDLILDGDADGTLLRFDAHGHYVHANRGLGGYVQIPLSVVSVDRGRSTVIGGLQIGGIYIPDLGLRGFGLVAYAGATLPTAADDPIDAPFTRSLRPMDVYQELPGSSTLRFGVSPMLRSVPQKIKLELFARMDVGLDVNVYRDGGDTVSPGAYLNLGAGFVFSDIAVMAESSLQHTFGDGTNRAFGLSVRGRAHSSIQPYGAVLVAPVTDPMFDFALVAGVENRL